MEDKGANLILRWYARADAAQIAHYTTSSRLEKMHYWLGLPAMILTTIVGSSIFASISSTSVHPRWSIATGIASIIAASMGAAQTFLRFSQRAEKHRTAGVQYSALKRELEQAMVFTPEDLNTYMAHIRSRWDQLNAECPTVSASVFQRSETAARAKLQKVEKLDEPRE